MRSAEGYPESPKERTPKDTAGFGLITALCPEEQRLSACISSRIPTVIQVTVYDLINCSWFNEPFAVSLYQSVYLDMHGLIFETSIWLLAGSTRYLLLIREQDCFNTWHHAQYTWHLASLQLFTNNSLLLHFGTRYLCYTHTGYSFYTTHRAFTSVLQGLHFFSISREFPRSFALFTW